ncbi:type II secretion system F family protein [Prochlorococcus marinus]|uniref:Type II secretion system F family protein n=1 Tax=Prochlorococcus marinus XMU1408 TaxID=2213228 RepID=A0A318R0M3_PROMR|nr:type II secretion system F family protein [Prochlorococcus marinus]PYE01073.1 type II secretion system F family protein [Prochlorococcus marinus XMU1408]
MPSYGNSSSSSKQLSKYPQKNNTRSILNSSSRNLKVPQKDLLIFFRQLAVILQSGVPLAQGIILLSENTKNKNFATIQSKIASRLSSGEELSICLSKYPKIFPDITIGLIEAGEAGGILDKVLDRIATLIEERAKIKSQIQGALIYPVIILTLAITVSLALLIFIVPKFEQMFNSMDAELPSLTKFMLNLSELVTSSSFLILSPIIIGVFLFLFSNYYKTKSGKFNLDSLILKIPLFGSLILRSEVASMCDTMTTLLDSGIPLVEVLEKCIAASSNDRIKKSLLIAIKSVREGQELAISLNTYQVFPKLVISMIKIGEETGRLSFMSQNLATFYKREVETSVSSLTKAMEPLIIIVVAGIVGTIVIALYLPMFKVIQVMQ